MQQHPIGCPLADIYVSRQKNDKISSVAPRCLHTATEVLKDLKVNATNVEEYVRETLGEDTCDARRSVSDPNVPAAASSSNRPPRPGPPGPCSFDKGLSSLYPQYKYRVREERCRGCIEALHGNSRGSMTARVLLVPIANLASSML